MNNKSPLYNETHQTNACSTNSVSCSFCNTELTSSTALREHLMVCGNKTDQCPKCQRFIRRAIFAYHFENNCANLEDSVSMNKSVSNSINTKNKSYGSEELQSIQPSTIVKCEFCGGDCCQEDYQIHKEKCLSNPKNDRNKQQHTNFNQNQLLRNKDKGSEAVYIPCELCNKQIELNNLQAHEANCRQPSRHQLDKQNRDTVQMIDVKVQCKYCKNLVQQGQLYTHKTTCKGKPTYAEVTSGSQRPLPSN